jgi:hypothetical protein
MQNAQLPIGISQAVVALASLAVFLYCRPREGKIKLPIHGEQDQLQPEAHDPFDVTRPEDFQDGQPIEEEKFWLKVCQEKNLTNSMCL